MSFAAQPATHIAGYQGTASVLTHALKQLADRLKSDIPELNINFDADFTASGDTAGSLFKKVNKGEKHICYIASSYLTARVPELSVLDIPFSVTDRTAALHALDNDVGLLLTAAVEKNTDYKVLGFWDNGFRHISNAVRPIRNLQDCQGLVIRTLDNAGYRATFNAMGFIAKTTDVNDFVGVIERGDVQAQENPLTNFMGFSIWRHHRYISLTSHYFGVLLLVCHREWFNALSIKNQKIVQLAADMATCTQRHLASLQDAQALEQLHAYDVQVIQQDALDIAAMRLAAQATPIHMNKNLHKTLCSLYFTNDIYEQFN